MASEFGLGLLEEVGFRGHEHTPEPGGQGMKSWKRYYGHFEIAQFIAHECSKASLSAGKGLS
jgi:hypothetical protein